PAVLDVMVKLTAPPASEGPEAAPMVSVAPRLEDRVTVSPGRAALPASLTVTVTVLPVAPSATVVALVATTVELAAETAEAMLNAVLSTVLGVKPVVVARTW